MFELQPSLTPRFVIHLLPRAEGVTVRVVSPAGDTAEKHTRFQRVEDVLRSASQPGFHEDVGAGLFRALLPGALGELYRAAYTQASLAGTVLTLDLHFNSALVRLARYPWELLHDGSRFVLQSGAANLVRTLDFPQLIAPYEPRGPLDVLVASAQSDDHPARASIYDTLDDALCEAIRDDRLDLAPLFPPAWDALMDWLLAGAPDVLHFEGHGDFTRTGHLLFEDERGGGDAVDAETLGAAFYSTRLRMIALSASDDAQPGNESLLSSVAPSLIQAGIPAVVAVQRRVPLEIAATFWAAFYTALLAGNDVESAVFDARQRLRRSTYWHAITLHRRTVPAPQTEPGALPMRPDTAAPDRTLVGWTVRAALWLHHPDAAPPALEIVQRVIGVPAATVDAPDDSPPPQDAPPPIPALQPGPVTVRLSAPCCVVHDHAQRTTHVRAGADLPPVWFALTPRQPGDITLTFELVQQDRVIAAVTHPMRVMEQPAIEDTAQAVAVLIVHGARSASGHAVRDELTLTGGADAAAPGAAALPAPEPSLEPVQHDDAQPASSPERVPPRSAGDPLRRAALPASPPMRTTRIPAASGSGPVVEAARTSPAQNVTERSRARTTTLLVIALLVIVIAAVIVVLVL